MTQEPGWKIEGVQQMFLPGGNGFGYGFVVKRGYTIIASFIYPTSEEAERASKAMREVIKGAL